ncbi:MAG: RimK family alpha-L-glutamate ligase, partial [Xanthobacteraceae bacterium]
MRPSLERFARGPSSSRPIVGLVIDRRDWHARELIGALSARGIETVPVRLHACAIVTASKTGLHIDGFGEAVPDALVVRTMSGGTFEAVTLRLGVLHALGELGVTVWNDARAIERCVDKSMTSFLLSRAGIATPATWALESFEQACAIVEREAAEGPLVLKPLFGSQGRG